MYDLPLSGFAENFWEIAVPLIMKVVLIVSL